MNEVEEITRGDTTVVMVNGYDAARQALSERSISKQLDAASMDLPGDLHTGTIRSVLFSDPPDHTRLRRLVSRAFTSQRIESMRPHIEKAAHELLDAIEGQDTVDLVESFALPLPFEVVSALLGIPSSSRGEFRAWTEMVADPARRDEWTPHLARLLDVIRELVADRRAHPGDGLLSELIAARDGEDRLSEDELTSMVFVLLVAGTETTINLIGTGVFRLIEDRSRWERLRSDPDLLPAAVEELVRFDSPATTTTSRVVTEAFEVAGHVVPAGSPLVVNLAAANRDPSVFTDPDELRLDRRHNPHLGFGHGIHYCVGAPLARLEARIAFEVLMERFPHLDLEVSAPEPVWREDFLRGLFTVPVRPRGGSGTPSPSES
ncbi:MAG TPA: cytochrome P450 [Amycolatopsis sp.]|uniref:cytochrome P450 family protein n=1 Tax=Amycolatopsis sp. TaxID=37632 RepID=UPI002F4001C4